MKQTSISEQNAHDKEKEQMRHGISVNCFNTQDTVINFEQLITISINSTILNLLGASQKGEYRRLLILVVSKLKAEYVDLLV